MNKLLRLAYGLLLLIVALSLFAVVSSGLALWQAKKVNHFIENVKQYRQPLSHPKALFAQAYYDVENSQSQKGLALLTKVVTDDGLALKTAAYYNRGNIHLHQAQSMADDDRQRLSFVELAKQDYRMVLLLSPQQQHARFNLELALRMVPELPDDDVQFDKDVISTERSIETIGFRVDLP
ncbi:MAG: MxaK protein [Methylophaga sp.]|nr:MAG: MxaK protein [Methylophaga sp.]